MFKKGDKIRRTYPTTKRHKKEFGLYKGQIYTVLECSRAIVLLRETSGAWATGKFEKVETSQQINKIAQNYNI